MPVRYTFHWSPQGRVLATIAANSLQEARTQFKWRFPIYAMYKGEVYVTVAKEPSPSEAVQVQRFFTPDELAVLRGLINV